MLEPYSVISEITVNGKIWIDVQVITSSIVLPNSLPSLSSRAIALTPDGVATPPTPSKLADKLSESSLITFSLVVLNKNLIIGLSGLESFWVSPDFSIKFIKPSQIE